MRPNGQFSDEGRFSHDFENLLKFEIESDDEDTESGENELDPVNATTPIHSSSGIALSFGDSVGQEFRSLSLNDVLALALQNSEFVADSASFLSSSNPLLNNPQFLQSTFDLELQKSSQEGVAAALADFDTMIATGVQWGRNSVILGNSNLLASDILINDSGTFYGRFDKPLRSGGRFSVIHNLSYASDSQNFYSYDPRFSGFLRGELRQPLLSGRGRAFTEIAGPYSYRNRQLNHGIALAELAEQTAEIEFQLGLERLMKQTQELYWDCWLALQVYSNQQVAMRNARELWSRIQNRAKTGLPGGSAADDAQAEENFYRRKSMADSALIELEQASSRLRHLLGMPEDPETPFIASDNPAEAPSIFELESSVANGLNHRQELIKQDLQIQAIEMQLFAARKLKNPQLDVVSGVQFNGLGDQLFDENNGAYSDLIDTNDVGWNVGFEFSMPLGFNRERTNIRYLTLLLAKAKSARQLQEKEIRHEISFTAKAVEKWSQSLESAKQQLSAAQRRLAAIDADFKSGRASLDLLLRSQDSVAQANVDRARSMAELIKAQLELQFRQGYTAKFDLANSTDSIAIHAVPSHRSLD